MKKERLAEKPVERHCVQKEKRMDCVLNAASLLNQSGKANRNAAHAPLNVIIVKKK